MGLRLVVSGLLFGLTMSAAFGQSAYQTIQGTRVLTVIDQAAGIATFSNDCGTQTLTQPQLQGGAIPTKIIPCPRPASVTAESGHTGNRSGGREIREPPEWKGIIEKVSPRCVNSFTKLPNENVTNVCKAVVIGEIVNVSAFTSGLWDDKQDPDWLFLKQFWQTGRQLYFSSTRCGSGFNHQMTAGAQMTAYRSASDLIKKWNDELQKSKFRPFLVFREKETKYECAPGVEQVATMTKQEAEDDEGENAAIRKDEKADRARKDNAVTFKITSKDFKKVRIKFYNENATKVWPSSDRSWVKEASDVEESNYTLSCQKGQKICYGAWRDEDESVSWGVGKEGKKGCKGCCSVCGSDGLTASLGEGPTGPPRDRLSFEVTSNDRFTVYLELVSSSRNAAWPGGGRAYMLNDSKSHRYDITCQPGEKICWGAYRTSGMKYWGAGRGAKEACSNCCLRCGSGIHYQSLNDAGQDEPSASASSGGGSVIDAIGSGIAIGSAIGSIVGGGGGGSRPTAPPRTNYGPDWQPGRSGISGGR